jgi:hypothetical protein
VKNKNLGPMARDSSGLVLPAHVARQEEPKSGPTKEDGDDTRRVFPMAKTVMLIDSVHVRPHMLKDDERAVVIITIQGKDVRTAESDSPTPLAITGLMRFESVIALSKNLKLHALTIPTEYR